MKPGDLVKRKEDEWQGCGGYGVILKRYKAGCPLHECADVMWYESAEIYGIACSRIKVISESR